MFATFKEAVDTNSECAFCHKSKFVPKVNEKLRYDLIRCADEDCEFHCKWDHESVVMKIELGGPDVISIASGWGA